MSTLAEPFRQKRLPSFAWTGAALAGVTCAAALLATSPGLPMAWDEGDAILRAEKIFQGEWQFTTIREGHPAFYGILIAAGESLSAGWLPPLTAARFGPMMLFAAAAGAIYYRMARDYSAAAAIGALGALLLLPRMFAHAHFASFDGPLTSCWILAWAAFAPAQRAFASRAPRRWLAAVLWALTLGMTLSCKATGWIAPVPFLVWTAAYRDRAAAKALAVGLPMAVATFFLLNPPLWQQPIHGWVEFFHRNLNRAAHGWNIPLQFLGEMHHLGNPLPWYNTIFWTAVTVPVGILLLAGVGVFTVLRRWRIKPPGTLLLANWLVLLVVRALPMAPPHDGVRLFLPSFAFLAALSGIGCGVVLAWAAGRWPGNVRARLLRASALGLLYVGSASSLLWYAPQWLSYYNLLIGGLPGATALGMEPTYYWDGLDQSVLDWLDQNTGPNEAVRFGACSPENLALMRRWGMLPFATQYDRGAGKFRWYLLQHRPSGWQPADVWLIDHARPVHQKTIRSGGVGPWRLDVPLVEVYDYEDYLRAKRRVDRIAEKHARRP